MNILHISRTMGQGGAEKVVYQLCKEKTNNITMIIASTGGYYEELLTDAGTKHYNIPDLECKNPIQMIKTYLTLHKIIIYEKIDIIHSHHRMAAFYSKILTYFHPHIKRVYTAHNVFNNKKELTKFSLQGSTIIACGNGVKTNLVNFFKINPKNIKIIYNSIENDTQNTIGLEFQNYKNKILIGTIGRLTEQKGIDVFIRSLEPIIKKNNQVYGIIIGDGELKSELIQLTRELRINNNVKFLGFKSNVLELIRSLDFLILASRWEGFPLTPIEAFSEKKTIIATNISGNNEIVVNNYNGLLFEKDNATQLTERINYLITNKSVREKLEKNAFNDYIKKYSYSTFIKKYYKIYKSL